MSIVLALAVASGVQKRPPARAPLFTTDVRALAKVDDELRGTSIQDAASRAAMVATFQTLSTRYPAGTFAAEIRQVVLVTDLTWKGRSVGGLADSTRRTIAMEVGKNGELYDRDWLARSLHHEVAHVMLDRYPGYFVSSAWLRSNAPGFRYRFADGLAALSADRAGIDATPRLNAQGLLNEYAASCYEEDLACVAAELLADDAAFVKGAAARGRVYELARRYPRLGAKFAQMRAFYSWPFRGIRLPTLPEPWGAPR